MKKHNSLLLALSAFVCLGSCVAPALSASNDNKLVGTAMSTPSQNSPMDSLSQSTDPDGAAYLQTMRNASDALNSYTMQFEMTVYKGDSTILDKGNFYFKKPLLRVEETGPRKTGSVAVLEADGKVRAHMGGPLSGFVVTLAENSPMLHCANGFPMAKSDFYSMCNYVQNMLQHGSVSKLGSGTIDTASGKQDVFILSVYDKRTGKIQKRAFVSKQTTLPVRWFDYTNGKLFAVTNWLNVKTNANIPDSLFDIRKSP